MRYLVKARVKPGKNRELLQAIQDGTLGQGSIAGDEYAYDMEQARLGSGGTVHWVETCYCATPLQEERPYWEDYFELLSVKDAHSRRNCRHENGTVRRDGVPEFVFHPLQVLRSRSQHDAPGSIRSQERSQSLGLR